MTDLRHDYIQTYIARVNGLDLDGFNREWDELARTAVAQFAEENIEKDNIRFMRYADMRYAGQEHTVKVPLASGPVTPESLTQLIADFHELHEKNYTFKLEEAETEIVNLHLTAFGSVEKPALKKLQLKGGTATDALKEKRPVYYEQDGWVDTVVYNRSKLEPGMAFSGPAVIEEQAAVTVIYPDQKASIDEYGNLIIETEVR